MSQLMSVSHTSWGVVPVLVTLATIVLSPPAVLVGPLTMTFMLKSTTGAGPLTLTVTESVSQALLGSQTWSWNTSVAGPVGAVNDGVDVLAPLSVTDGPEVWLQA